MAPTEPTSSPDPGQRDISPAQEGRENPTSTIDLTEPNDSTNDPSPQINMHSTTKVDALPSDEQIEAPENVPEVPPPSLPSQPQPEPLVGQIDGLSISEKHAPEPEQGTELSSKLYTPLSPEKYDSSIQPSSATMLLPSQVSQPNDVSSLDTEAPHVPDYNGPQTKQSSDNEKSKDEDNDSQPEIQSIMGQFQDPSRPADQEEIMSPRLGIAEQFRSSQGYYPPRRSSLENAQKPASGSVNINQTVKHPASPSTQHSHQTSPPEDPMLMRRSSTSTLPPLPEPEPDQPFDFHRFLEQLRHRTADPVAKFLRSFLMEFGKKQWMVHEQVKIISDFLAFITNKMALCEVWRDVSDSEFDNAKEGMEKLVMNRLYSQTFAPAIPAPPSIPRSASRSRRKEIERMHGPWRRGQHQEDIERDDILAQKIRIYNWVREEHLDIPSVSGGGRRFLNLAQQGINSPFTPCSRAMHFG